MKAAEIRPYGETMKRVISVLDTFSLALHAVKNFIFIKWFVIQSNKAF
jgi:hypothetical protein